MASVQLTGLSRQVVNPYVTSVASNANVTALAFAQRTSSGFLPQPTIRGYGSLLSPSTSFQASNAAAAAATTSTAKATIAPAAYQQLSTAVNQFLDMLAPLAAAPLASPNLDAQAIDSGSGPVPVPPSKVGATASQLSSAINTLNTLVNNLTLSTGSGDAGLAQGIQAQLGGALASQVIYGSPVGNAQDVGLSLGNPVDSATLGTAYGRDPASTVAILNMLTQSLNATMSNYAGPTGLIETQGRSNAAALTGGHAPSSVLATTQRSTTAYVMAQSLGIF